MEYYERLTPLRDVLAGFYKTPSTTRTIVAEAGIPEQLIDFDGPAVVFWKNILDTAEDINKVQDLIAVVAKTHFRNEDFKAAGKHR